MKSFFLTKKRCKRNKKKLNNFKATTVYSAYLLSIAFTKFDPKKLRQMAVHLSDVLNCWNAFATIIIKANCLNIQVRQFIIRIVNRGTSVRLSVWPNWPNFLTIILMGWYFFNCLNIGLTPIQEGRNHTCMYLSILIVNHNDFICYVYLIRP